LDSDSKQTIIAADAGSYDFSSIRTASGAQVAFAPTTGAATITYFDKFVGSAGNDIVKGGADSFGYDLGKGDDTFIGTDTANELVVGGEGNDTITLGDNTDVTDTLQLWDLPFVQGANTGRLINSLSLGGKSDYVGETFLVGKGTLPDATFVSFEDGAYADGGAGDDKITSGLGDDVLIGGAGNDSISGGKGSDIISAGEGDDILSGGEGGDFLAGGAGNDLLEGNAGEDYLFGGKGRDVMRGDELDAAGNIQYLARDHFIFEAGDSGSTEQTVDIIKDFLGTDLASTLDLDGNGIKGDEGRVDTIYHNWFAAAGSVGANGSVALATDLTGGAANANVSGTAYATFTSDIGNTAVGTTLEAAANSALDKAYAALNLNGLLAGAGVVAASDYTSQAVQFEYGGKEYLVIDAYVTGGFAAAGTQTALQVAQAANNYNAGNDLIVEIADTAVSWSVNADDIVVTRWEPSVL
jgi:Ca2+-binding RTX toxin-like protein